MQSYNNSIVLYGSAAFIGRNIWCAWYLQNKRYILVHMKKCFQYAILLLNRKSIPHTFVFRVLFRKQYKNHSSAISYSVVFNSTYLRNLIIVAFIIVQAHYPNKRYKKNNISLSKFCFLTPEYDVYTRYLLQDSRIHRKYE